MKIVTLNESMYAAATAVYLDRQKANAQFGEGIFDKSVAYHNKLNLRANITNGTTRNKRSLQSKYINYTWAHVYEDAPNLIWTDFFRPAIMNSCSRIASGLNP